MNKAEIRKPLSFRNASQLLDTSEDKVVNETPLDNAHEGSDRTLLSATGTDQTTLDSSFESSLSSSDQISDELLLAEQIRREKERNEPYQMFFYYPKYLHPEAVALIAQNLLNEWEEEENKLSATKKGRKRPSSFVKTSLLLNTMDFGNYNIQRIAKTISETTSIKGMISDVDPCISLWNKTTLGLLKTKKPEYYNAICSIIDKMGEASAKAQSLPYAITTSAKIQLNDNNLYLYAIENKAMGIIKVGKKKLFYRNLSGDFKEIEPLCVLDFYVSESCQRKGIGKLLFEAMTTHENMTAEKLAYDRPSPKLIAFLRKHYGLSDYIPQSNNFVIFKQYFSSKDNASLTSPYSKKDFYNTTKTSIENNNGMSSVSSNLSGQSQTNSKFFENFSQQPHESFSSKRGTHYNPITHQLHQDGNLNSTQKRTGKRMIAPPTSSISFF
nr:unnamed protein product [Naegleria fowleri]